MLEQRLKRAVQNAYLDYSRRGKEKCPWKVLSVVNFVVLNLVFLNHTQEKKGLVYTQCMLAKQEDVRDILDWITRWLPQIVNMLVDPISSKKRQLNKWALVSQCHFTFCQWIYTCLEKCLYKLLELQCNWKVQNHTQGPQKVTRCFIQFIPPGKITSVL